MPAAKRTSPKKSAAKPEELPAELSPRDHPTSPSLRRGFGRQARLRGAGHHEEELSPRDHRRLGAELELFTLDDMVGSGLPLWLPKGATVRRELERFITDEEIRSGYQHVITPHLGKDELYLTSGHLPYYKDTMFPLMELVEDDPTSPKGLRGASEKYVLKPMNCPHHIRIFQARPRSYRDLPMRLAEFGTMYRYEKSGQLMGLTRVRGMTLNDAHIFSREAQLEQEILQTLELIQRVYKTLGLTEYWIDVALHDPKNKKKYANKPELWKKSENALRSALKHAGVPFNEVVGDAAFYGPKADIQMKDVVGHTFAVSTIQLDMMLPERFGVTATNEKGGEERLVIIHRGVIGTHERFIAFLIEHFNGLFPLWLAPVQVRVLPVSKESMEYAESVYRAFKNSGLRAELESSDETVGKKIRTAEVQKIPVMAVVGPKEAAAKTVALRIHGGKDLGAKSIPETIQFLKSHIEKKSLNVA